MNSLEGPLEHHLSSCFFKCHCPGIFTERSTFNTLQWHHNKRDCVSNHQPRDCLLNRLFRLRSKKTSKLRVTSLCAGNSPGPVNSPHKWPVTRKMFPFDDVIMKMTFFFKLIRGHFSLIGPAIRMWRHSHNELWFFSVSQTFEIYLWTTSLTHLLRMNLE